MAASIAVAALDSTPSPSSFETPPRLRKRVVDGVCLLTRETAHAVGELYSYRTKHPQKERARPEYIRSQPSLVLPTHEPGPPFAPDCDDLTIQDANPAIGSSLAPIETLPDCEGVCWSKLFRRDTEVMP